MKYLIKRIGYSGEAIVEYDEDGTIIHLESSFCFNAESVLPFVQVVSNKARLIDAAKNPMITVTEVPDDLSFDRFWEDYYNKKGNKKRVKKIWESKSDKEKVKALAYIKEYDHDLKVHPRQKKYPQTYLNDEEWNN